MDRKPHLDDFVAEFLKTITYSAEAYPKKIADGPDGHGQFPDGNCNMISDWDTQTVVCVPSPHDMLHPTADVSQMILGTLKNSAGIVEG